MSSRAVLLFASRGFGFTPELLVVVSAALETPSERFSHFNAGIQALQFFNFDRHLGQCVFFATRSSVQSEFEAPPIEFFVVSKIPAVCGIVLLFRTPQTDPPLFSGRID